MRCIVKVSCFAVCACFWTACLQRALGWVSNQFEMIDALRCALLCKTQLFQPAKANEAPLDYSSETARIWVAIPGCSHVVNLHLLVSFPSNSHPH